MDMSKLSKVDAKSGSVDDLITFLSAINSVEKEPVVFLLNEDDYHWDFAGITTSKALQDLLTYAGAKKLHVSGWHKEPDKDFRDYHELFSESADKEKFHQILTEVWKDCLICQKKFGKVSRGRHPKRRGFSAIRPNQIICLHLINPFTTLRASPGTRS